VDSGARRVQIGVGHERQGVGHRDEDGTGSIEPGDKAGELTLVLGELVTEGAAQAEVVAQCFAQGAHQATSQGSASSRSAE
jgi:hypothetical protein